MQYEPLNFDTINVFRIRVSSEAAIKTLCAYGAIKPPATTSHEGWRLFLAQPQYLQFWADVNCLPEDNNREWMKFIGAVLDWHDAKKFFHNQIRANSLLFHCQRVTPYQLMNWYNRYMVDGKSVHPIFNAGAQPINPSVVAACQRSDVKRLFSKAQLTRVDSFLHSPMAEFFYMRLAANLGISGDELNNFLNQLPKNEFLRQMLLSVGITAEPEVIAEMVSISHYGQRLPVTVTHERGSDFKRVSVNFNVPLEQVYPLNDGQHYQGWLVLEPKDDIPF